MSELDPENKEELVEQEIFEHRDSNIAIESTISNTQTDQRQREKRPLTRKKNIQSKKKQETDPPAKGKRKKWIFFILVISSIASYFYIRNYFKPEEEVVEQKFIKEGVIEFDAHLSQKFSYVKQVVDHYQLVGDTAYFPQKIILDVDPEEMTQSTPIFLSIAPFKTATEPQAAANMRDISSSMKGFQLQIEPRFFGASLPFGAKDSFTVSNLKYLTINQIFEDVAYAIKRIIQMNFFGITKKNPWFITGEGHSAILALWFRAKYPKLTVGAYASSPIIPNLLVPNVSVKLYSNVISGGKTCRSVLVALLKDLLSNLNGQMSEGFLLDMGLGVVLKPKQALELFMDRVRQINRYTFVSMCSQYTEEDLFKNLKQLLYQGSYIHKDPLSYSIKQMSSPEQWEYFIQVRTSRAFEWLRCNELGMYTVSPVEMKYFINFKQLNEEYYKSRCKQLFSTPFQPDPWPRPDKLVASFESDLSKATNMFIVHGYYDIWLPYAYKPANSTEKSITTNIVKCSFCVHNFDAIETDTLYKSVDNVRKLQREILMKWALEK